MNQTKTSHADPVEDQVVTGVDGEELSELINQYEESAKNTSNDKDEDGGNLRTFQNKIFKGVLRYTAIAGLLPYLRTDLPAAHPAGTVLHPLGHGPDLRIRLLSQL